MKKRYISILLMVFLCIITIASVNATDTNQTTQSIQTNNNPITSELTTVNTTSNTIQQNTTAKTDQISTDSKKNTNNNIKTVTNSNNISTFNDQRSDNQVTSNQRSNTVNNDSDIFISTNTNEKYNTIPQIVTKQHNSTVTIKPVNMTVGKSAVITATVRNEKYKAVNGSTVLLFLNNDYIGKSHTGIHGIVNIKYTPSISGVYELKAIAFGNDTTDLSYTTIPVTINKQYNSTVTITTPVLEVNKQSIITATIRNNKNKAVKDANVTFYINNILIGQTVTGKYGIANIKYTPKEAGNYTIIVKSSGNTTTNSATNLKQITVLNTKGTYSYTIHNMTELAQAREDAIANRTAYSTIIFNIKNGIYKVVDEIYSIPGKTLVLNGEDRENTEIFGLYALVAYEYSSFSTPVLYIEPNSTVYLNNIMFNHNSYINDVYMSQKDIIENHGTLYVNNSIIQRAVNNDYGCAIAGDGPVYLNNSILNNNRGTYEDIYDESCHYSIGIANNVYIENTTFINPGNYYIYGGKITAINSHFNNSPIVASQLTMINCTSNKVRSSENMTIISTTFKDATIRCKGNLTIISSNISNNYVSSTVYDPDTDDDRINYLIECTGQKVILKNNIIKNNKGENDNLINFHNATVIANNNTITNNTPKIVINNTNTVKTIQQYKLTSNTVSKTSNINLIESYDADYILSANPVNVKIGDLTRIKVIVTDTTGKQIENVLVHYDIYDPSTDNEYTLGVNYTDSHGISYLDYQAGNVITSYEVHIFASEGYVSIPLNIIMGNPSNTTITVNSHTLYLGNTLTIKANVDNNGGPLEKNYITFKINGKTFKTTSVDVFGDVSTTLKLTQPGDFNITVISSGTSTISSSQASTMIHVLKQHKSTISTNSLKTTVNKKITLTATIKNEQGKAVRGSTVLFIVNNTVIGKTITGQYGIANIKYTPKTNGTYTLTIASTGNTTTEKSITTRTLQVGTATNNIIKTHKSTINIALNMETVLYKKITVTTTIKNELGKAVKNSNVIFVLGNKIIAQKTTGKYGIVTIEYTPTKMGLHDLTVIATGNSTTKSSITSSSFDVKNYKYTYEIYNTTQLINAQKDAINNRQMYTTFVYNLHNGIYTPTSLLHSIQNKTIIINGQNKYKTIIDGSKMIERDPLSGALYPLLSISGKSTVYINNVTFNHNTINKETKEGTKIITSGGNVYLNNVIMTNTTNGSIGGAIINAGTMTINNTKFINNSVNNQGGAIYNTGKITIGNTIFINNTSNDEGGAIYTNGLIYFNNDTFINSSSLKGGAIYSVTDLNISNCNFKDNHAQWYGSCITVPNALSGNQQLNIDNCTFINHKMSDNQDLRTFVLTIKNSLLINCRAIGTHTLNIMSTTVENTTSSTLSVITAGERLNIYSSTFKNNYVINCALIENGAYKFILSNNTFINNKAVNSTIITNADDTTVVSSHNTFINNKPTIKL